MAFTTTMPSGVAQPAGMPRTTSFLSSTSHAATPSGPREARARPSGVQAVGGSYRVVMATATCGWCGKATFMKRVLKEPVVHARGPFYMGGGFIAQQVYQCANCASLSVVTWYPMSDPLAEYSDPEPREGEGDWLPPMGAAEQFPDVPEHIASAASEAFRCGAMGAHRAAGSMARAVVEAVAKDMDIGGRNLEVKIDKMAEQGMFRDIIRETAHEIRHFGNDMAHGDFVEDTTKEEADEVLGLMREVLHDVYQTPARVLRRRRARESSESLPPVD